jgi:hypothetical protein
VTCNPQLKQQSSIQDMTKGHHLNKRKNKRVRFQQPEDFDDDDDEDDETCRCICGDNNFTAKRPWIQCTACEVWQHNECMNVSVYDDKLGDHYWCDECDEETHAGLLAAVRRGERPWEARAARRRDFKVSLERQIEKALAQVGWLWELYKPHPSVFAGDSSVVPSRTPAPGHYVDAVQAGSRMLFEELPMQSLRDIAKGLDLGGGRCSVMKTLRRATAKEFYESDVPQLGVLAELFEWAEKGALFVH